jgi:hypothetical protein
MQIFLGLGVTWRVYLEDYAKKEGNYPFSLFLPPSYLTKPHLFSGAVLIVAGQNMYSIS